MQSPFYSGRISPELNSFIEAYRKETGQSRTQVLTEALAEYTGFDLKSLQGQASPIRQEIEAIKRRIEQLEQKVEQPKGSDNRRVSPVSPALKKQQDEPQTTPRRPMEMLRPQYQKIYQEQESLRYLLAHLLVEKARALSVKQVIVELYDTHNKKEYQQARDSAGNKLRRGINSGLWEKTPEGEYQALPGATEFLAKNSK